MTKFKSGLVNLLLSLGGIGAGILIIEIICISTGVLVTRDWADRHRLFYELWEPNERLGFKAKSNLHNFKMSWTEDPSVSEIVNTDNYGFRNPGRDYATSELYFVGDSFTWGFWVDREKTFYGIIESQLKQPVISLGTGGYGFEQYEILFQDFVAKYKPRTAVLCVFANDLTRLAPTLKDYYQRLNWTEYESLPWYKKSFFYQILFKSKQREQLLIKEPFRKNPKKARNGITLYQYRGAAKDYLKSGTYTQVEKVFSRIIELNKKNRVKLFVFLFPSKESTYITDYANLFHEDIKYLENEEIGYKRLCQLAKLKDVICVDLTHSFRQNSEAEKLYFNIDAHWNIAGHKLAAREIFKTLEPR